MWHTGGGTGVVFYTGRKGETVTIFESVGLCLFCRLNLLLHFIISRRNTSQHNTAKHSTQRITKASLKSPFFYHLCQVKVVTLKGHVISKTGSMTGGTNGRDGTDRWEEKVSKINQTWLDSSMLWHGLVWCMQQLKFLIFIIALLPDSNHRCYHSIFCYTSLLRHFNSTYNPNFHCHCH